MSLSSRVRKRSSSMTQIDFVQDSAFAHTTKGADGLVRLRPDKRRRTSLDANTESDSGTAFTPHTFHSPSSSRADVRHLAELAEFVTAVAEGVSRVAFPRPQQPYATVHALMISWEEDDLRTEHEISKLKTLFEDVYRYSTNHYKIPSSDAPEFDLDLVLSQTNYHHGRNEDGLLIIYYGGHGELEKKTSDSIWKAWRSPPTGPSACAPRSPQLNWSDVQRTAMRARGDILFILDCCYASGALRTAHRAHREHTVRRELLLASGNEKASNQNSLTKAIISELEQLQGSPCTISSLHSSLLRNQSEHGLRPTPIFTCLTGANTGISIAPLLNPMMSPTRGKEPMITPYADLTELASPCRVLISVALSDIGGQSMQKVWVEWFRDHAPSNVTGVSLEQIIKPEAVYISNSYHIIFSIPVSVWNAMSPHPAVNLVSVVRSDNLIFIERLELGTDRNALQSRLKKLLGDYIHPDRYRTLRQENLDLRKRISILEQTVAPKAAPEWPDHALSLPSPADEAPFVFNVKELVLAKKSGDKQFHEATVVMRSGRPADPIYTVCFEIDNSTETKRKHEVREMPGRKRKADDAPAPASTLHSRSNHAVITALPFAYTLVIRQQPVAARACGFSERDRRVIDPPPILELKIVDKTTGLPEQDHSGMLALHCTLLNPTDQEDEMQVSSEATVTESSRRLMGTLVASPYQAKDQFGIQGTFFVFPDTSCRTPGRYRLQFKLIRIDPFNYQQGHTNVASVITNVFNVYTPKDFPGMRASSALLKALRRQGLNVSVKIGSEARRGKGRMRKEDASSLDDVDSEGSSDERGGLGMIKSALAPPTQAWRAGT
jgi:hypothetical protein